MIRGLIAMELPGRSARVWLLQDHIIITFIAVLVFLSSAIFATSLRALPAILVIAGSIGAVCLIGTRRSCIGEPNFLDAKLRPSHLCFCIGVAFAIFILGGETHLFFPPRDWLIRDAVLSDLSEHGFQVQYQFNDENFLLRAPLGIYIIPALVGKYFGLLSAHIALLTQNAIFLGSIFYLLMRLGRGWRHIVILILFSGLSLLGAALTITLHKRDIASLFIWGIDAWHPYLQYSSSIVQFFWVPNHALPGWWLATLMLLNKRADVDVATIGVFIAGLAFWSPLVILPAVPWLIYLAVRHWRSILLSVRVWMGILIALTFIPIIIYILIDSTSIPGSQQLERPDFGFWYVVFVCLQLPAVVFIAVYRRLIDAKYYSLIIANLLILLILPFFKFGSNNDLAMRGSIVPLTILSFFFGLVVLQLTKKQWFGLAAALALIITASASGMVEMTRSLAVATYKISSCSLVDSVLDQNGTSLPANYAYPTKDAPKWLIAVPTTVASHKAESVCQ